ncbi:MAG: histidine phosphatase family protein [Acidimicrobiales bacterium]
MLILVRHGRTAHNASRRLLGRLDVDLDELGERQAAALGHSPRLAAIHRVVSSPLRRTAATAGAIAAGRRVQAQLDSRWVEVDYGVYDGLALGDVPASVWDSWRRDPEWVPDGGESIAAVARRVRQACEELWPEAVERDVAVVSHVSPIKAALTWGMGLSAESFPNLFVEVASLHRIGPGRDGAPTLLSLNEIGDRPAE